LSEIFAKVVFSRGFFEFRRGFRHIRRFPLDGSGAIAFQGCLMRISVCFQGFFARVEVSLWTVIAEASTTTACFPHPCGSMLCTIAQESINLADGSKGTG
jgi:hypothetical protein